MLPAGIIGNIVAGLMIEKFRLTCHQIIKVLIVFAAITTAGTLILLMIDEIGDFAGVTAPYNSRFDPYHVSLCRVTVGFMQPS